MQGRRAAEHRERDLIRRSHGCVRAVVAHAQVPRDVLDDDDRVVDEQPERDDEARDRKLVQREPREFEQREADRERQRDRDHHDADARSPSGSRVTITRPIAIAKSTPSRPSLFATLRD